MRKARRKASAVFEKICVQLIFLLSAFLLLFLGIRAAGKTIEIARAEKIEIINNLVEGLSEGSNLKRQSKKLPLSIFGGVYSGSGKLRVCTEKRFYRSSTDYQFDATGNRDCFLSVSRKKPEHTDCANRS